MENCVFNQIVSVKSPEEKWAKVCTSAGVFMAVVVIPSNQCCSSEYLVLCSCDVVLQGV